MKSGIGSHTKPNRGATVNWITPREIVEALGPFDLDPCACVPQPWPCAAQQYTIHDDGLKLPWHGRVWLNPPYSSKMGVWLEKLADHGNGIALIFARTETDLFVRHVWKRADGLMFLWGRLYFFTPNGSRAKGNAGGPSVLVAYGSDNLERLREAALSGLRGSIVTSF